MAAGSQQNGENRREAHIPADLEFAHALLLKNVAAIAADAYHAPCAAILTLGGGKLRLACSIGIDAGELTDMDGAGVLLDTGTTMVLDAASDARFRQLAWFNRDGFRFYAGTPIVLLDGRAAGLLAVLDRAPRSPDQHDHGRTLEILAGQASALIELEHAEESRLRSEHLLSGIIDQSPFSTLVSDADGWILRYNAACLRLFEIDPDDALGHRYNVLTDPVLREQGLTDLIRQVYTEGRTAEFTGEYDLARLPWSKAKPSTVKVLRVTIFPIKDSQGRVVNAVIQHEDVTAHRQAEIELRRLNRALRAISACNQILVRATQHTDVLSEICKVIVDVTGYRMAWVGIAEADEARTVRVAASAGVDDGYLANVRVTWSDTDRGRGPIGTAIRTGKACLVRELEKDPIFAPWRTEASRRGYKACLGLPLMHGGQALGALGIYSADPTSFNEQELELLTELADDVAYGITTLKAHQERASAAEALRQSEERFRQLAESIKDVFWIVTPDFSKVLYVSPAYDEMWGRGRDELYARPSLWIDSVVEEDRVEVTEELRRKILSEFAVPAFPEYRISRPDGSIRWIQAMCFPIHNESGQLYRVAGIARDITEQKRAEEQREQLETDLRHSQKMEAVGQLAAGVAHDFNNLLTAILCNAQMIMAAMGDKASAATNARIRDGLQQIQEAGDRAAALTRQLLAFSRKQVRKVEVLDPNAIVGEMERMLRRVLGEHIVLETSLAAGVHRIRADAAQVQQVILNLAVNARDAMPTGGRMTIKTSNVRLKKEEAARRTNARPGDYVEITIRDTGEGMNEATLARIFEPFFTTKPAGQGTGLGLATVYGIMQQSDGHITVESTPGHGAVFGVYFPAVKAAATAEAARSASPSELRGTETVLVCEDQEVVRHLACRILAERGYTTLEAGDADEAMRVASKHAGKIDLLLTDVVMPGMNGQALAEALRAQHPGMRILMVSGYAVDAGTQIDSPSGGFEFMPKPYDPVSLLTRIRALLDRKPTRRRG